MKTISAQSFIRQQDIYSCAAACLATAAALCDTSEDYDFFCALLKPDPAVGVGCDELAAAAKIYLPVTQSGENCYTGNLAIGCIFDGVDGHYVIFLAQDGDNILYYDPLPHRIVEAKITEIDWRSEAENYKNWCIDLPPLAGTTPDTWRKISLALAQSAP